MKRLLIGVLALTMAGAGVASAGSGANGGGHDNKDKAERHQQADRQGGHHQGGHHQGGQRHGDHRQGHPLGTTTTYRMQAQHPGWGRDYGRGHRWQSGQRIGYSDWRYAQVVDYRRYHLRHPRHGYQWRRVNDQYVLAAIATGVILSVILINR